MSEGRTILLVEDDAMQREVMGVLLRAEGWTVVEAADGDAALATLRHAVTAPEVILCDLQMPGLSGTLLAEKLREQIAARGGEREMRLLAMTATPPGIGVAGYDGVLKKPVDVALLMKAGGSPSAEGAPALEAATLPAVLDRAVWDRLQGSMAPAGLRALCAMVLTDADTRTERMRVAMEAGQHGAFRREAHTLKGSAAMIGARRLAALASEAEAGGWAAFREVSPKTVVQRFVTERKALQLMLEEFLDDMRTVG